MMLEVCVIPENCHCGPVAEIYKAELAPGSSLLCCLSFSGGLRLWDPADREARPFAVDGNYSDFSWEEVSVHGSRSYRLLAVSLQWDLKLLEVEAERSSSSFSSTSSVSLSSVWECPAGDLLQTIREQGHDVNRLQSVQLLSFAASQCWLLLNGNLLLQLQWQQADEEFQAVSSTSHCCRLQLSDSTEGQPAVHHVLCAETLFALHTNGLISVCSSLNGSLLAIINLPAYLNSRLLEDEPASVTPIFSSSFHLLQVSADLSTAVAVTAANVAVAVDLNHYFRMFPGHLQCAASLSIPSTLSPHPGDQDSLTSSSSSLAALGVTFRPDGSWEARLASLYSATQQTSSFGSSSSLPTHASIGTPWSASLPHLKASPLAASSRAPRWGSTVNFSVPEASAPSALSVCEFSAQLTFTSTANRETTVALWDLESGAVSYHQVEGEATPVQRCSGRQHRLLLRPSGLFQVLFSVSQQELLSKLMLFGNAATVDAVCNLNSWGRCSIPIHSLRAGLKNRQLDTVEFYLKSKENLLDLAAEQPGAPNSSSSLSHRVQELCPALDLLCSAVRDSNSEAQSRQFCEQLLNITMSFVNTQIRLVLTNTQNDDTGADVLDCVSILDRYLTELRPYMAKYPWPAGGDTSSLKCSKEEEAQVDEWEGLQTEEVIRQSILTNQIPRAQAVFRRRGQTAMRLSALRMEGLRLALCCLHHRDLQTADRLLTNMGFSVRTQLHSISLHTLDKDLREFVVEELSQRGHFPDRELQSVAFMSRMEALGSLPATRCSAEDGRPMRLHIMTHQESGSAEEVLGELLKQRRREDAGLLWKKLRLDWVRNWDHNSQTAILLSRLHHTEVTSCDPVVLWRYLTTLHDRRRVIDWIESSGASQWPELTPALVNDHTACSTYLRENILDVLARRGLFIPEELADLQRLLWRLAQDGGVMASSPPIPQYRSALGLDLHAVFITFCLHHGLQYLLYTYLEHYRLTPRNCTLLTNQSMSESQPWLEMLVRIQEISRDLLDPGLLFQASLTSAQVLLPGSQASLSGLLLEGHSLLALASVMFAPGGIDQVLLPAKTSGGSDTSVDPQLLKMALAPYPKLKAALFPAGPRGQGPAADISLYHLLQCLHPLDSSRLFGWQTANMLNSTETSELPHFSSSHLVNRFALVENLDFLYYLRHGRPSFAFATFLVQQLSGCSDIPLLLQQARHQVYHLALQCFNQPPVAAASVCFCELLGVCSLQLRVDVRALNTILQHRNTHAEGQHSHRLASLGVKLAEAEPGASEELIGYLEAAVMEQVEQKGLSRSSYEAGQEWALPVQFCQLHNLALSSVYPAHCAQDGHYINFLLFVQLHNFPPQQVRSLATQFGPTLQDHLNLAFQDLQASSVAEPSRDSDRQPELFQVLLHSLEEAEPCRYLLHEALVHRWPTLAVMAACQQGAGRLPCLCVWLLTSVNDGDADEATSHLAESPWYHEWNLHDLSIIWRTLLGRGLVRPLLRGFELFQRDCPLVLVLRMFELCCNYRNFSEAKAKLLDFQRTLLSLRNSDSGVPPGGFPLQWVESQASVLLLTMLQRCSSQFDLHRLLQLLAEVDKLLKSNGPDFKKLSQLSQLLQGTDVLLPPRLLQCTSASIQQEEFLATVEALQAMGRYSQARQVAQLAGLSVQGLLLSQLLQEANSQRAKRQWARLESRAVFWKKCHEQLKADSADASSASSFLLSQADGSNSTDELLDVQERCLLLCLAAHWLSELCPPPVDQLEQLEKQLWLGRLQRHLLAAALERQSVFSTPTSTIPDSGATLQLGTHELLLKEFSPSGLPALNTEACLRLDTLPAPGAESPLSTEEQGALSALIGQLLDEESVHEASRVCRYFSLRHPDVLVALQCHGLATGDLGPSEVEEEPEASSGRSLTSSSSTSSLAAYAILPPLDDRVALQLQKLVDQCRHGATYCKRVFSLYQLSKELQCSFNQVCSQEPRLVLEQLLLSEQPERFRKAQAFIRAQALSPDCVAELVSAAVVRGLLNSSATSLNQDLQQSERQMFRPSEGRDSLVQLIKLCNDPNLVGLKLLENLSSVPLRELSSIVELLIVAHDCFSLTCNMEGIVRVLQVARHMSHAHLAPGLHNGLLVRLLTGIARYNEMTYIFDILHQSHSFEALLRKKLDTGKGQSSSLKTALLDYLKRWRPGDSEKHNMVALCFSMRREIGENLEMAARTQLKLIESQEWEVTEELNSSLASALGFFRDAAVSFSKDSCVRQASRCVRWAKLVTLQQHFLNQGSELRLINLQPAELPAILVALPRCYQVFVVSEAYGVTPDWAELLYQKVVINGDFAHLEEVRRHRPLTASLFEDIFRKLGGGTSGVTSNVKRLLTYCDDVHTRYRLAYQQNLYDVTKTLLQDAKTSSYLNDRLAV